MSLRPSTIGCSCTPLNCRKSGSSQGQRLVARQNAASMFEQGLLVATESPQVSKHRSRLALSKATGCRGMSKPAQAPAKSRACQEFAFGTWMTMLPSLASISSMALIAALGSRWCSSTWLLTITSNAPLRKQASGRLFCTTGTPAVLKNELTGHPAGAAVTTAKPRRCNSELRIAPPPRSSTVPPLRAHR